MHTWFHVQLDLKNLGRTLMCVSSIYVTAAAVPDHESSELDFEYPCRNNVYRNHKEKIVWQSEYCCS